MAKTPFHPIVDEWFAARFGEPTDAQRLGWPEIAAGRHTLIAAPTGSGKTLAAFLSSIDALLRQYVSVIGLSGDPQVVFNRYAIDYIVFPPGTPLAGWLDGSGAWHRVYTDATAAVWVRS